MTIRIAIDKKINWHSHENITSDNIFVESESWNIFTVVICLPAGWEVSNNLVWMFSFPEELCSMSKVLMSSNSKCTWNVGTTNVWPCFSRPKLGECKKWDLLAKLWAVKKNWYGHNFQNIGSKLNQRGLIDYEPTLIRFGSDILKIVAVSVFFYGSF